MFPGVDSGRPGTLPGTAWHPGPWTLAGLASQTASSPSLLPPGWVPHSGACPVLPPFHSGPLSRLPRQQSGGSSQRREQQQLEFPRQELWPRQPLGPAPVRSRSSRTSVGGVGANHSEPKEDRASPSWDSTPGNNLRLTEEVVPSWERWCGKHVQEQLEASGQVNVWSKCREAKRCLDHDSLPSGLRGSGNFPG